MDESLQNGQDSPLYLTVSPTLATKIARDVAVAYTCVTAAAVRSIYFVTVCNGSQSTCDAAVHSGNIAYLSSDRRSCRLAAGPPWPIYWTTLRILKEDNVSDITGICSVFTGN